MKNVEANTPKTENLNQKDIDTIANRRTKSQIYKSAHYERNYYKEIPRKGLRSKSISNKNSIHRHTESRKNSTKTIIYSPNIGKRLNEDSIFNLIIDCVLTSPQLLG